MTEARLACVVLAYADVPQVRRLVEALDPFPVVLHVDARTDRATFEAMTDGLPARCILLPRRRTGWGEWGPVEAEIEGYRAALEQTDASHVAVLSGNDYPLRSSERIIDAVTRLGDRSLYHTDPLPHPDWRGGGFWRLRYRHWVWRKHVIELPVPRRLPRDVTLAGGSALKLLARRHAEALVRVVDTRPDLVRFWRRSWCPDETFVASVLSTPGFVPDWSAGHVDGNAWWIGWDGTRRRSPDFVTLDDVAVLRADRQAHDGGHLFVRKVGTAKSGALLDEIDRWRAEDAVHADPPADVTR